MARPINVAIQGQTDQLIGALSGAERAVASSSTNIAKSTSKIDDAYSSVADSADTVASRGAQLSGALGGLSGVVGGLPGPFGAAGAAMEGASVAAQAFADAGDLVNFVTDLGIGKQAAAKVQTIATTGAQKGAAAAAKVWAIAQRGLNIVLSLNPIGLVVIAIIALVAIFVVAYKRSDKFREIVDKAFRAIKKVAEDVAGFFTTKIPAAFAKIQDAASTVIGWIKKNWPLILAILTGPFGLAVLAVVKNFDRIKELGKGAIDFVRDKFNGLVDFFKGLPGTIGGIFSGLWDGIADTLKNALNSVLQLPLTVPEIDIPVIGKVGGQTLIPALAKGGIVTGPTLALIGEAGPEAVIPLNGQYATGSTTVNINVTAGVGDPVEIGRTVQRALDAYRRSGGRGLAFA